MIEIKDGRVNARELYFALEAKKDFSSWIREKIDQADLTEGRDFSPFRGESSGGRPKAEYSLTLEAAKEICLLQQTPKGKELRRYLLSLDKKVQNFELKTDDQFVHMMKVIDCLQFMTNQKEAFDLHQSVFVTQSRDFNPYAAFAKYKAAITGWDKKKVDEVFRQWLVRQGRSTTNLKTMSEKINAMDPGEAIRIAVMDILFAKGTESELTLRFAEAVKRLADKLGVKTQRKNEPTLFAPKSETLSLNEINPC